MFKPTNCIIPSLYCGCPRSLLPQRTFCSFLPKFDGFVIFCKGLSALVAFVHLPQSRLQTFARPSVLFPEYSALIAVASLFAHFAPLHAPLSATVVSCAFLVATLNEFQPLPVSFARLRFRFCLHCPVCPQPNAAPVALPSRDSNFLFRHVHTALVTRSSVFCCPLPRPCVLCKAKRLPVCSTKLQIPCQRLIKFFIDCSGMCYSNFSRDNFLTFSRPLPSLMATKPRPRIRTQPPPALALALTRP